MLGSISQESMRSLFELVALNDQDNSGKNNEVEAVQVDERYLGHLDDPFNLVYRNLDDYSTIVMGEPVSLLADMSERPYSPASSGFDSGINSDIIDQQNNLDLSDIDKNELMMLRELEHSKKIDDSDDLLKVLNGDPHLSLTSAADMQNTDDCGSMFDVENLLSENVLIGGFFRELGEAGQSIQDQFNPGHCLEILQVPLDNQLNHPERDDPRKESDYLKSTVDIPSVKQIMQKPIEFIVGEENINISTVSECKVVSDHSYANFNPNEPSAALSEKSEAKKSKVKYIKIGRKRFDYQDISEMSIDKFNDALNKESDTKVCQLARDIRRRGRNKVAAQKCRKRKLDEIGKIEVEVDSLRAIKKELESDKKSLLSKLNDMKKKLEALEDEHGVKEHSLVGGKLLIAPR